MNNLKNRVQLIGHLGMNPEVRNLEKGTKMARFSLATHEVYTNQRGEKVTETHWHNVVIWGKTAETAEKYLQKGQEVAVEGRLVTRSYTDKDGQKRFSTEVVVNEFLMLGNKKNAEA